MRAGRREATRPSGRIPLQPRYPAILGGLLLFGLLTLPVHGRWLAGVDLAVAAAQQVIVNPLLDGWAAAVSILVSAEASVLYGLVGSYLLWSRGLGLWSLAPLTFVLGVPLELLSKQVVQQPLVPPEFWRPDYYPLVTITLNGSFPSGHAMRSGFFCVFVAILWWEAGGPGARWGAGGLLLLALLLGYARIYGGQHWLSDVVAGLDLGVILALLVAPAVARRWRGVRNG